MTKEINGPAQNENLPWYANGSLRGRDRRLLERHLLEDPQARAKLAGWNTLRQAVIDQPLEKPDAQVRQRVMSQIQAQNRTSREPTAGKWGWLGWMSAILFTLAIAILLWVAVQPGVRLEWSVNGEGLAGYRVYRAAQGSEPFELIGVVPYQQNLTHYSFVDAMLLPGQVFVYKVEGVGISGDLALSRSIASSPFVALPGQLAILFSSLVVGVSLTLLIQYWPSTLKLRQTLFIAIIS